MLGAGLQFNRSRGEDRFYNAAKARKNHQHRTQQQLQTPQIHTPMAQCKEDKSALSRYGEPDNQESVSTQPLVYPTSNVERFLQAITPSVPAQYISKTTVRGWRTSDVELKPYFVLGDLWESFKEWSAYGAGVPLLLNGSDSVIQYYVPYLSAIQIYVDPSKLPHKQRQTSEDSDADYLSRDSSSDGSSDSERDRISTYSRGQQNAYQQTNDVARKMQKLSLRDHQIAMQEGFSSDDSESGISQAYLLFQYLEHAPPYSREPLADKISDLAVRFPELKNLRSCDVTSSSWVSVAWYPIYRIPTGPTLKDLDACFLTYHTLHTPAEDVQGASSPPLVYRNGIDSLQKILLPVFGLYCYKFRASVWSSNGATDCQLVNKLSHVAEEWLRLLQVDHPDYIFFLTNK